MTVDELVLRRYRSWMLTHGCGLATAEKGVRYLRWFQKEKGLTLDPDALTDERVTEFLASWRQAGVKPRTLNSWVRELNLWSRFNRLGWKLAYFHRQEAAPIQVPDGTLVRKLLGLTWPDRSRSSRDHAVLLLLADVGIRRNELVHLQLNDRVQMASGPGLVIRFGKGERTRSVPIDQDVHDALEEYIRTYRARTHPSSLFTTEKGPVSYAYVGELVKRAGRRVGAPWLSAHKLRHFVVDTCLDAGMPVASVAELMGHVRWETTQLYRQRRLAGIRAEEDFRATRKKRSAIGGKVNRTSPKIDSEVTGGRPVSDEQVGARGSIPRLPNPRAGPVSAWGSLIATLPVEGL